MNIRKSSILKSIFTRRADVYNSSLDRYIIGWTKQCVTLTHLRDCHMVIAQAVSIFQALHFVSKTLLACSMTYDRETLSLTLR